MKNFNELSQEGKEQIISIIIEELEHNGLPNETISDRYGNLNELHYKCFNEDYFVIGYYQAFKWLNDNWQNGISAAIDTVKQYEVEHFGEFTTDINSESICNMLVYILGEEIIYSLHDDMKIKKVIKQLKNI